MATSDQPQTFSELQTDLISRIRDSSSDSGITTLAQRYLNIALHDMHLNPHSMPYWAIRRAMLLTHAPYTTGTISITAAARTTVTGASTLWNTAVTGMGFNNARTGGKIKPSGVNEVLEVSSVASDTSITLVNRYTGDALSAASYTYYEDEYALATDFLRFADLRMFSTDQKIPLIGPIEFNKRYARNDVSGKPRVATLIQLDFSSSASPRPRVVLHPYPDDEYPIPYNYVTSYLAVSTAGVAQTQLSASTDEPIIPREFRHGLVFHALYHYYRDRKNDARSQEAKAEYVDIMQRAANQAGLGQRDNPRIQVVQGYRRRRRQARRFEGGAAFDRLDY